LEGFKVQYEDIDITIYTILRHCERCNALTEYVEFRGDSWFCADCVKKLTDAHLVAIRASYILRTLGSIAETVGVPDLIGSFSSHALALEILSENKRMVNHLPLLVRDLQDMRSLIPDTSLSAGGIRMILLDVINDLDALAESLK
jgi:hypothetical protein